MHNYIWCPYYLPSFMKFCLVVSEELCWQAASEVYLGKFFSSKGHNSHKFRGSKLPGNMHNYIWCPYYLPSFMKFCSVVSEELRWQTVWRTDGQTDRTKTICLPTKVRWDIKILLNFTPQERHTPFIRSDLDSKILLYFPPQEKPPLL